MTKSVRSVLVVSIMLLLFMLSLRFVSLVGDEGSKIAGSFLGLPTFVAHLLLVASGKTFRWTLVAGCVLCLLLFQIFQFLSYIQPDAFRDISGALRRDIWSLVFPPSLVATAFWIVQIVADARLRKRKH